MLALVPQPLPTPPSGAPLDAVERLVLSFVDGVRSAAAIAEETGLEKAQVEAILLRLKAQCAVTWADEELDLDDIQKERVLALFARTGQASFYDLLGVAPDADKKAIKKAYYAVAMDVHPDRFFRKKLGSYKAKMESVFARLTEAHDVLSDATRRAEYDRFLVHHRNFRGDRVDVAIRPVATPAASPSGTMPAASVPPNAPTVDPQRRPSTAEIVRPSSVAMAAATVQKAPVAVPASPASAPAVTPPRTVDQVAMRPVASAISVAPVRPAAQPTEVRAPDSSPRLGPSTPQPLASAGVRAIPQAGPRPVAPGPIAPGGTPKSNGEDRERREALAKKLLGSRPSSFLKAQTDTVPEGAKTTSADAADALRRRYEEQISTRDGRLKKQLMEADAADARGDYEGAFTALRVAIQIAPESRDLALRFAMAQNKAAHHLSATYRENAVRAAGLGKWDEASSFWRRLVEVAPTNWEALERAADAIVRAKGNLYLANDLAKRAADANPAHPQPHITLATVYIAAGQRSGARASVEQARGIAPNSPVVAALLAEYRKAFPDTQG